MTPLPQPSPGQLEPTAPSPGSSPVSIAEPVTSATPQAPPPHLLWETLETAFGPPEETPPWPSDERLSLNIALPVAVVVSLVLWVIIVELVLRR